VSAPHRAAPRELSGLTLVRERALLERRGWDLAFWSVSDELSIAEALVLIGHPATAKPDEGWVFELFGKDRWRAGASHADAVARGSAGRDPGLVLAGALDEVTDSEAVAYHDDHVYVIGSHSAEKSRFLAPNKAFVARFAERDVEGPGERGARLDVVADRFGLHRAVNDALNGIPLLALGRVARRRFVEAAQAIGARDLVSTSDHPINIEGLAFLADGTALIGLRYPVSEAGCPIVVELAGFAERVFGAQPPKVTGVRVLTEIALPAPCGIRDIEVHPAPAGGPERVSMIVGGMGDELLDAAPPNARFEHWMTTGAAGAARKVRGLPGNGHVEGVAHVPGERFAHVRDAKKHGEPVATVPSHEPDERFAYVRDAKKDDEPVFILDGA
jgi:hypothetical protein